MANFSDSRLNNLAERILQWVDRDNVSEDRIAASPQLNRLMNKMDMGDACRFKLAIQGASMQMPPKFETKVMPKIMEAMDRIKPGTMYSTCFNNASFSGDSVQAGFTKVQSSVDIDALAREIYEAGPLPYLRLESGKAHPYSEIQSQIDNLNASQQRELFKAFKGIVEKESSQWTTPDEKKEFEGYLKGSLQKISHDAEAQPALQDLLNRSGDEAPKSDVAPPTNNGGMAI